MCQLCDQVKTLWPDDDDDELTEEQFDDLFLAAREIELLPGPHSVGTGVSGEGVYTWVFDHRGHCHAQ